VPAPSGMPPALGAEQLADRAWEHTSVTFAAHGYRFAVRSNSAPVGRFVTELYAACATTQEPPVTWYSLIESPGSPWPYALYIDERRAVQSSRAAAVLNHLTWHVNRGVIDRSAEVVLLHAAAATIDGRAVVLPAPMESGKTTLVAGLVEAGFGYLTDEAVGIDPVTLDALPYAKPLSIDPGSWDVLAGLEPQVDDAVRPYLDEQWQLAPSAIRHDAPAGPTPVAAIVLPRYERGAPTQLRGLRRSEALVDCLRQTFHLHEHGRRDVEVLGRLLAGVPCYALVSGDLAGACDEVTRLLRETEPAGVRGA
jgi:hypothetical protein